MSISKVAILAASCLVAPGLAHAADAGSTLGEVVVTAQRRSERLLDVPQTITTVSSATLQKQGISQVLELSQTTPGLKMDKFGSNLLPAIRGVSTQVASGDANVALYIDGIYQPLVVANNFKFPDLDRIEVLKGPQGALYGRNATGGAVLFVTREPSFTPTGEVAASYGSFNDLSGRAFISGPLVEGLLAASVSATYQRNDGYIDDVLRGGKANPLRSRQIRGKLLVTPTDTLTLRASAFYGYLNDPTGVTGSALNGNSVGRRLGAAVIATQPYTSSMDAPVKLVTKTSGGYLKADQDLGFATLNLTGAYLKYNTPSDTDIDYSSAPGQRSFGDRHARNRQAEAVLASNATEGVKWLGGANYYYFNNFGQLRSQSPGVDALRQTRYITKAKAVFGEATLPFGAFSATVGYRYTEESSALYFLNGGAIGDPVPRRGKEKFESGTPRITLKYAFDERSNVYATYSEGFKSGLTDSTTFRRIEPEKLKGYEVGLKTRAIPRVSLDAAAFYYDYRNQQTQIAQVVNGVFSLVTTNAARSRMYGLDGVAQARLTDDFSVTAGLSLLDAKVKDYPNALVLLPAATGGNTNSSIPNAAGKRLYRAPKWTLSLTGDYTRDFEQGALTVSATAYHTERVYYEFSNRISQKPYTTLDARASWQPAGSNFKVALFGRNLTDVEYFSSTLITTAADGVTYAPPRTVGVEASYAF